MKSLRTRNLRSRRGALNIASCSSFWVSCCWRTRLRGERRSENAASPLLREGRRRKTSPDRDGGTPTKIRDY